jgi:hypothetical protein
MEPELEMLQKRNRRLTRERVQRSQLGEDDYHMVQAAMPAERLTTGRLKLGSTGQMPAALRD